MKIKSKMLIAGLLVLSGMVVLAGTAAAITSIQRTPDSITIANSETGTFTVTVRPSLATDKGDVSVDIAPQEENFSIAIKDEDGIQLGSGSADNRVTASAISYIVEVDRVFSVVVTNNGAPEGSYGIKFAANDGTVEWGDDASIWAGVESGIPEFATIAIPAAAILGLFLFFNHRKRKKE